MFLGESLGNEMPPCHLYFSANFWFARAYATDSGGEVIRNTIKEAAQFEHICTCSQTRGALKGQWEEGLRKSPGHLPTIAAVQLLGNEEALRQLCREVRAAKAALTDLIAGGHPVVYAVRVEPEWFGEYWKRHVSALEEGKREVNLRCSGARITTDRIVAKVSYPNGTDPEFTPTWFSTWENVPALSKD
jgi:hypothetical protein